NSRAAPADRRSQKRRARSRDRGAGSHRRPGGPPGAAGGTAVARSQGPPRRRRSAGAGSMMRAVDVLALSLAAVGGATAVGLTTHASRATVHAAGGRRAGADSARVAALLAALAHTDPVICDLIGVQLGNF